MKKYYLLLSLMLCMGIASCEKEESEADKEKAQKEAQYKSRLEADHRAMRAYYQELFQYYYWHDEMQDAASKISINSQTSVEEYFEKTLYEKDRWSWMTDSSYYVGSVTGVVEKTYGATLRQPIDYYEDYSITVAFIYPESPLTRHGVTRGWKLTHLAGIPVMDLIGDGNDVFNYAWLKADQQLTFQDLEGNSHTFTESPADALTENPCLISKVFGPEDYPGLTKKVGYFHYLSFMANFNSQIDSAMQMFHDAGVQEMIVDLRYNSGGDERALDRLAGYLAPKSADGHILKSTNHNKLLTKYHYNSNDTIKVLDNSLELERLFVIMSGSSASSSECLVNGLTPYMEVNLVGRQSYGKPNGMYVLLYPFTDADYERYSKDDYSTLQYVFLPIAFFNKNSLGESIPDQGFVPDSDRPDDLYHDFGVDEDNIRACLEKIVSGSYPDLPSKKSSVQTRAAAGGSCVLPDPKDSNPLYGSIIEPLPRELRLKLQQNTYTQWN